MTRHFILQTGATSGEFSPRLYGRLDVDQYRNAFEQITNAIPLPQGPLTKRPGTQFVIPHKDETKKARTIDFIFNVEQAYVLEFGEFYIRIHRNRGTLLSGTAITNGTFDSDISGWTDASVGTGSISHDTDKMELASGVGTDFAKAQQELTFMGIEQYTLTLDVITNPVTIRFGTTAGADDILSDTVIAVGTGQTVSFTPSVAGSVWVQISNETASTSARVDNISLDTPILTLDSPYTEEEVICLDYTQSADVLFLTTINNRIHSLTRQGAAQWELKEVDVIDGPYDEANADSSKTLQPSATTGTVTITAAGHAPFTSGDIGRWVRIDHGTVSDPVWGAAVITGFTSSTQVTAEVSTFFPFNATTAKSEWRLGQWSDGQGWPEKCTFHEQRFVMARSTTYLDTVWTTESIGWSKDSIVMSPTNKDGQVIASNAINAPLSSGQSNAIEWMSSGSVLAIGAQGSESILEASDRGKALAPDNHRVILATASGCRAKVRPIRVNGRILFAQRIGFKINEFQFAFELDAFTAPDITILADHINRPGVAQSAYVQSPFSIVWWLLEDGTISALTYVAEQEVGGWSKHEIGGSFGATDHAVVEDITAIPSQDGEMTELWMSVKRTIDGNTRRYIEVMHKPFFRDVQQEAFYSDSYLIYSGALTDTITGLDHLEGETVWILSEGSVEEPQVVTGGQIVLDDETTYAVVGLPNESIMRTLSYEAQTIYGSAQGSKKRLTEIHALVYETQGLEVGRDLDSMRIMPDRAPNDLMDTPPPLISDWVEFNIITGWDDQAQIYLRHSYPLPFTLSALAFKANTNEG